MNSVALRLRPSFFVRAGVVAMFTVVPGLLLLLKGGQFGMYRVAGIVPLLVWSWMYVFEYFRGARTMDEAGVTRRDGRQFAWADLRELRFGRARLHSGELGPLNHLDMIFPRGRVRVFPFTIENVRELLGFIEWLKRTPGVVIKPATDAPLTSDRAPEPMVKREPAAAPKGCGTCGELGDYHRGFQKGGREEEDTFLPAASLRLTMVAETKPGQNRSPLVKRCPECGAYFLYEVEYDFLVSGSEDEQHLTRLTPEEAGKLRKGEK